MHYHSEMVAAEVHMHPIAREFQSDSRLFQGIASVERTEQGRLYACFYGGREEEKKGNYVVLAASDDDGVSWVEPLAVIKHPDPEMRLFDPNVWLDPDGRLWLTFSQSYGTFDGRHGVWAAICDRPDEEEIIFAAPRRIANGVMMCKPIVLSTGEWMFPCAVWGFMQGSEDHPDMERERYSNVYVSVDHGAHFTLRGGADVPNRSFDEHMIVERRDGSLWMLVRRFDGIGEAFSWDRGHTWWNEQHSGIPNPCTRFFIRRLKSGNLLLINHVDFRGRNNLMAKLSFDDGKTWVGGLMLDERENVSYPDGTQSDDGVIYIAYDRERLKDREILMAKFREKDILADMLVCEDSRLRVRISKGTGV